MKSVFVLTRHFESFQKRSRKCALSVTKSGPNRLHEKLTRFRVVIFSLQNDINFLCQLQSSAKTISSRNFFFCQNVLFFFFVLSFLRIFFPFFVSFVSFFMQTKQLGVQMDALEIIYKNCYKIVCCM